MSVYLMNCLVPQDSNIRVTAQNRSQKQAYYRVDAGCSEAANRLRSCRAGRPVSDSQRAPSASLPACSRLGMRHIARVGSPSISDSAPSTRAAARCPVPVEDIWRRTPQLGADCAGSDGIHNRSLDHAGIGAWGLVSLPSRLVEVLIAFSILVSAAHALRPLFPGREPIVAAFFGLIHGLFATTLQNLGVGTGQRIASILGFNLGIEMMQMVVVAAILPSLLILSRTAGYTVVRFGGALFAGLASLGWITERLSRGSYFSRSIDRSVARGGISIAALSVILSIFVWLRDGQILFTVGGEARQAGTGNEEP